MNWRNFGGVRWPLYTADAAGVVMTDGACTAPEDEGSETSDVLRGRDVRINVDFSLTGVVSPGPWHASAEWAVVVGRGGQDASGHFCVGHASHSSHSRSATRKTDSVPRNPGHGFVTPYIVKDLKAFDLERGLHCALWR